ncbi:MAG: TRAP transporter large permease subunit [Syntrophobacterales bacterium]|nr:TRAP transporter large permease subunit [Syntrophobacterales bacterium]
MSPEHLAILMFVALIGLIIVGFHVAFVLGSLALIFGYLAWGTTLIGMLPARTMTMMTSYEMGAITLFIFMGCILERAGIAERLYGTMHILMGKVKGGLLLGTMMICIIFAACTGIGGAAVIMMGLVAIPSMMSRNYDKKMIAGCITAGGGLGVIIPPSIMLILYGPVSGIGIARLFVASAVPGLIIGISYLIYIAVRCKLNPELGPPISEDVRMGISKKRLLFLVARDLLPPVVLILGVLGSIFFGIASPTEAAGVGAFLSLLLMFVYGRLNLSTMHDALLSMAKTTGMVFLIMLFAGFFTTAFMALGGGEVLEKSILGISGGGKMSTIVVMLIIILILGMFMDWIGTLLVIVPIFVPIIKSVGADPVWFAILFCITLQISYITPPFAYNIFFLKGIAPPEMTLSDIMWGGVPYIFIQIALLFLFYAVPELTLWLPRLLLN